MTDVSARVRFLHPDCDLAALATGTPSHIKLAPFNSLGHPRQTTSAKNILITGANGFLGTHVIQGLLAREDVGAIYCFIRDKKGKTGAERLQDAMAGYGLAGECVDERVHYLPTAYTEHHFGLNEDDYEQLCDTIDMVFHFASDTDYQLGYADFRQNFALKNLDILTFCNTGKPKAVHYVCSTIAALFDVPEAFQRQDIWWHSGYSKTKWINSHIYREAAEQGVQACVYKPPYIVGSTELGIDPGYHYSYWRMIIELMRIRTVWEGEFFQVIPVDVLSEILIRNAFSAAPEREIIPTLPTICTDEITDILGCDVVSFDRFMDKARTGFRKTERIMLEDLAYESILNTNLMPSGVDDDIMARMPSYADVLERGLRQTDVQRWIRKVRPERAQLV